MASEGSVMEEGIDNKAEGRGENERKSSAKSDPRIWHTDVITPTDSTEITIGTTATQKAGRTFVPELPFNVKIDTVSQFGDLRSVQPTPSTNVPPAENLETEKSNLTAENSDLETSLTVRNVKRLESLQLEDGNEEQKSESKSEEKNEGDEKGDDNDNISLNENGIFNTAVDPDAVENAKRRQSEAAASGAFLKPESWDGKPKPVELSATELMDNKAKDQNKPSFNKGKGSMQSRLKVGLLQYYEAIDEKCVKNYQKGIELMKNGLYDRAAICFNKAINLRGDVAGYYALRGECFLRLCDFQSAILNFKKVCSLEPNNPEYRSKLAFIYFFFGQTLFDQKLYDEALESFTKAAELEPETIGYHTRSIACLVALQRHGECMALINKRLENESRNADLFVLRARLHDMFRNYTLCSYDVRDALAVDPEHVEALKLLKKLQEKALESKQQAVTFNLMGKQREALLRISTAIETDPDRPEFHVFRGAIHRRMGDFNSAIDDYLLALDKTDHDETSPIYADAQRQLLLTYNDFAVECFSKGYYEEAILLLNKAIKGEKREKGLYINRGDCFYRQGDLHFGLADYHQALELDPSDPNTRSRISVVHNEFGVIEYQERNFNEAESRFTLAIQNNPKIGQYYVSRARARFILENYNGARQDVLLALLLDPTNEEIMSMLTRLFPGKSVKDILESKAAYAAKYTLQNLVSTAPPVKLEPLDDIQSESSFDLMADNFEPLPDIPADLLETDVPTPKKEEPKGFFRPVKTPRANLAPDLKTCMEEKDFQIKIAKEKKKVNEKIHKVFNDRQTLKHLNGKVTALPAPAPYARRGIATNKGPGIIDQGQKPAGWRKYNESGVAN